ncbi:MAG: hypothetical protein EON99_01350, partial [Chitinophagaceae bacterium]
MTQSGKSAITGYLLSVFLTITCCSWLSSFAQEKNFIAGRVLNGETEALVPNASVFITNTSKGTITAANGTFELKNIPQG